MSLSLGLSVCLLPLTITVFTTLQSDPRDLWPLKHLTRDNYKDKDNDKDKYIQRTPSKSNPRDLWPLRHLIRVMRWHDLTEKNTMTKTNTIREHLQRAIFWDFWTLRHLIRVMRKHDLTNKKQRQRHLDNTFKEWFQTPLKHWLQFDNWELDIMTRQLSWPDNWNTGQHSQLLRCLSS